MGAEIRYPFHDAPTCPKAGCGGPGCLYPYNPSGWYGPVDATIFCQACGTGWCGSDDEIEQALIADTWYQAWQDAGLSERAFAWATSAQPANCGKTCFRRGCQQPWEHFGPNAKVCPAFPECGNGYGCSRCCYLLKRTEQNKGPISEVLHGR